MPSTWALCSTRIRDPTSLPTATRLISNNTREPSPDGSILDHLWFLSKAIGKGLGTKALHKIEEDCHDLGIAELTIISDPNTEGFCLHGELFALDKPDTFLKIESF